MRRKVLDKYIEMKVARKLGKMYDLGGFTQACAGTYTVILHISRQAGTSAFLHLSSVSQVHCIVSDRTACSQ